MKQINQTNKSQTNEINHCSCSCLNQELVNACLARCSDEETSYEPSKDEEECGLFTCWLTKDLALGFPKDGCSVSAIHFKEGNYSL